MSLARWQIRGINRVAQELNRQAQGSAADGEVIVKFRRGCDGAITMQVLNSRTVEMLRAADQDTAVPAGSNGSP